MVPYYGGWCYRDIHLHEFLLVVRSANLLFGIPLNIHSFEFFVYDVPSQPEICSIQTEEIIKAYNESRASGTRGGNDDWLAQYYALKKFHDENGNCVVPFGKETGALRSWTERQKKLHASSKLEQHRVEKLKLLGFDFTIKKPLTSSSPRNNKVSPSKSSPSKNKQRN